MIDFHRSWESDYKKLRPAQQERFREQMKLFMHNPRHPFLNNHALHGTMSGFRSLNVGGDLRAVFRETDDSYTFYRVGTHHQLYGK